MVLQLMQRLILLRTQITPKVRPDAPRTRLGLQQPLLLYAVRRGRLQVILESEFGRKATEAKGAGVWSVLAVGLDGNGVGEGGLADSAPGVVLLGVVLHFVEAAEPLFLAGEAGECHVGGRRGVLGIR
jgi:hypothetical protein